MFDDLDFAVVELHTLDPGFEMFGGFFGEAVCGPVGLVLAGEVGDLHVLDEGGEGGVLPGLVDEGFGFLWAVAFWFHIRFVWAI